MGRLEFGPERDAIEVIDIETGNMVFSTVAGQPISLRELTLAIHAAGYEIAESKLTARGVVRPGSVLWIADADQELRLAGDEKLAEMEALPSGTVVRVVGLWRHEGDAEVIDVQSFEVQPPR